MKKYIRKRLLLFPGLIAVMLLVFSCSEENKIADPAPATVFPVKIYALERSPKINRMGAAMDFIHDETTSDTLYLHDEADSEFSPDAVFYNLMVYFEDDKGDIQSEGCPAILLASGVKALEVGAGVEFFTNFDAITGELIASLEPDVAVDFEACKNDSGFYDRELVMAAYDQCVIGNKFRSRVLEAPDDAEEQDVQPVFLIQTLEGGYVKFMVKQFKGDGADKQKTIVQWQVLQE